MIFYIFSCYFFLFNFFIALCRWFYIYNSLYDCRKALQDPNSVIFRLYVIIVGIYAGVQFFISFLMRIPACHLLTNQCDRWPLIRFVKWLRQVCVFICICFCSCVNNSSYFVCSISCVVMLNANVDSLLLTVEGATLCWTGNVRKEFGFHKVCTRYHRLFFFLF